MKSDAVLILTLLLAAAASSAQTPAPLPMRPQPVAVLSPQANAWISQEAARESAANQISPDVAVQAASRSGIAWGSLSGQVVAGLVMRAGAQQTDAGLRAMFAVAQARKTAPRSAAPGTLQRPASPPPTPVQIAHSPILDSYLASLALSYDSLAELSAVEQLRLQMAMDRLSKFMQTLSNIEKKASDTDTAIIQSYK